MRTAGCSATSISPTSRARRSSPTTMRRRCSCSPRRQASPSRTRSSMPRVQLRERWLEAVRAVATTLLAGDAAHTALQLVAKNARELVSADMATISVPEAGGLRIMVADGAGATELIDVEVPLAGSLSEEVIRTERTMVVEDARTSTLTQPMVSIAGVGPMILVPLALRTSSAGVLAVGRLRRTSDVHRRRYPFAGKLFRAGESRTRVRTRAVGSLAARDGRGSRTHCPRSARRRDPVALRSRHRAAGHGRPGRRSRALQIASSNTSARSIGSSATFAATSSDCGRAS